MTWKISWSDEARKQLRKLSKQQQSDILRYLTDRILGADHPCDFGKPLKYDRYGLWRYRVGDMRVICQIRQGELLVLILQVGHCKYGYQ